MATFDLWSAYDSAPWIAEFALLFAAASLAMAVLHGTSYDPVSGLLEVDLAVVVMMGGAAFTYELAGLPSLVCTTS